MEGAGSRCEARDQVSKGKVPVVARNCSGGATYRRRVSAKIFEHAGVEVGDCGLGGVPGLRAELLLRLAEAERRRNSGTSVAQGPLCGG